MRNEAAFERLLAISLIGKAATDGLSGPESAWALTHMLS
jgi:hypothetical protein